MKPRGLRDLDVKSFLSLATKLHAFLSLASKVPSNGYSSNSQRVRSLSSYLWTVYLATIQLSTGSATLASDKFRALENETEMSHPITSLTSW